MGAGILQLPFPVTCPMGERGLSLLLLLSERTSSMNGFSMVFCLSLQIQALLCLFTQKKHLSMFTMSKYVYHVRAQLSISSGRNSISIHVVSFRLIPANSSPSPPLKPLPLA